jgi:hypothetical protein
MRSLLSEAKGTQKFARTPFLEPDVFYLFKEVRIREVCGEEL